MSPKAAKKILVIGSGIGGLVAAARLAHAGYPVHVFEQARHAGGYLNPYTRKKFDFSPGLHLVSENETSPFGTSLASVGVDVDFIHLPSDGFEIHHFPGLEVPFVQRQGGYFEALEDLFPESSEELRHFHALLRHMGEDLDWFNDRPLTTRTDLLKAALGLAWRRSPNVRYRKLTWQEFLDLYITDPRLKAVLSAWCNAVGLPPKEASCLAGAGYFSTFRHYGGNYIRRGARGLRDALAQAISDHGGTITCARKVTKILWDRRGVSGLELEDGESIAGDIVVSNADPKQTYGELLADYPHPKRIHRMLRDYQPARGYFFLCLGLDPTGAEDNPLFSISTRRVFSRYDLNAHYDLEQIRAGVGPLFFVTCPSSRDGTKAPAGRHILEIVSTMPAELVMKWAHLAPYKRGPEYEEIKAWYTDRILQRLEAFLPDIRDRIVVEEAATPATHYSYTLNTGGTGAGMALTPRQMGPNRGVISSHVKGLLMCGSGSPLGPSLVRCAKSGWLASGLVLDRDQPGACARARDAGTW